MPPPDERTPAVIRVMVASGRPLRLKRLLSAMSADPGVLPVNPPVTRAETLVASVTRLRPDVLLLDQSLMQEHTVETFASLADVAPGARVLLLSDRPRRRLARLVLRHRFHGYMGCREDAAICIKAIRSIHRGELWLPRLALAEALSSSRRLRADRTAPTADLRSTTPLTQRENQVVNCLRKGLSNKEIASQLGIKEDTVKKHLRRVFSKLGVRRRTQLILRGTAVTSSY